MFNYEELGNNVVVAVLGAIGIGIFKFFGSSILKNYPTKEDTQEIADNMAKSHNELVAQIAELKLKISEDKVNQLRECSSCRLHAETTKNDILYSMKFDKEKK